MYLYQHMLTLAHKIYRTMTAKEAAERPAGKKPAMNAGSPRSQTFAEQKRITTKKDRVTSQDTSQTPNSANVVASSSRSKPNESSSTPTGIKIPIKRKKPSPILTPAPAEPESESYTEMPSIKKRKTQIESSKILTSSSASAPSTTHELEGDALEAALLAKVADLELRVKDLRGIHTDDPIQFDKDHEDFDSNHGELLEAAAAAELEVQSILSMENPTSREIAFNFGAYAEMNKMHVSHPFLAYT
jgi:hypothetical protein